MESLWQAACDQQACQWQRDLHCNNSVRDPRPATVCEVLHSFCDWDVLALFL